LQPALASLVTGRAIERVVEQQVLERGLLSGLYFFAVGDDHHAVGDGRLAAGNQLRLHRDTTVRLLLADFHQTHATTGNDREARVIAVVRNLDVRALSRLNAVDLLLCAELNCTVIDINGWHF
jgi:hypothetical protein